MVACSLEYPSPIEFSEVMEMLHNSCPIWKPLAPVGLLSPKNVAVVTENLNFTF